MQPIVIIGSGLGGYSLAREIRKLDKEIPVLILTADDGRAYSKPMLSSALGKGRSAASLASADAAATATQLNLGIRTGVHVTAIDRASQSVQMGEEQIPYRSLVLALGADPIRLPITGDAGDRVLSVNDLHDYERFREAIEGKRQITILGGGLIGCEFANDLASAGYRVTVIDRNNQPLGRLLPEALGQALQSALAALGVEWLGGRSVSRVDHHNGGVRLILDDGGAIDTDVVLSAIGLRPRTQLASGAGLQINRGIVVNRWLQSSDPDIYALGDCAEVEGHLLPFVMPLMRCARTLAQTLTGTATKVSYPAMPVVVKTPAHPLAILPPAPGTAGAWQIASDNGGSKALFVGDDGQLQGFALSGAVTSEANRLAAQIAGPIPE